MSRLVVAAGLALITGLTWFEFPGHTWLQQDTQIYVPILEHLRDPSVLRKDPLVQSPHVSYTLYDESARALRSLTGLEFREVLEGEQLIARALGIWGLYLMASALGLPEAASLLVAAIVALGAAIGGPAVLSFELEPDPRSFAVPLLFLAIGLVAHRRDLAAGVAASAAFLMHPPAVYPFWLVYLGMALWRRRGIALLPLAGASIVLVIAAHFQQGSGEAQVFFGRLSPSLESLQRMRAPYSYVSEWSRDWLLYYLALAVVSTLAYFRLRRRMPAELRWFSIGLPLVALLSVPSSFLLLEIMKWGLLPQVQPMRALLFVVVVAQFSAAAAAIVAGQAKRYPEAFAWFVLAYLIPMHVRASWVPSWREALAAGALALFAALASGPIRWNVPAWTCAAGAGFFLIPALAGVRIYSHLHTAELAQLSAWARRGSSADAVFLFADAGKQLAPGIFRAEAQRALYVDWKSGGQVNYLSDFGSEWWKRWEQTLGNPAAPTGAAPYRALGIDYLVLSPGHRLDGCRPVFENASYQVCAI